VIVGRAPMAEGISVAPLDVLRLVAPGERASAIDFEAQLGRWPEHHRAERARWDGAGVSAERRWIVTNRGAIVASAALATLAGRDDTHGGLGFRLVVAPAQRQRGIGSRLLGVIEDAALGAKASQLVTTVDEQDPASLAFALAHGYRESRRQQCWSLRLSESRAHTFPPAARIAGDAGLALLDYAQLAERHADAATRFALAHRALLGELPQPMVPAKLGLRDYQSLFLAKPAFEERATFVALHRDEILGLTLTQRDSATLAYSAITAVSGVARARRIGLALKLAVIAVAPTLGITELVTLNDADNALTLRILRGLGYRSGPDLVRFRRAL
jgi:L-amino acid N-acyltransferase YncA